MRLDVTPDDAVDGESGDPAFAAEARARGDVTRLLAADTGPDRWPAVYGRRWEATAPRAVLVVAHGAGEHGGRYRALAEALAGVGVTVIVPDLPGHGETALHAGGPEALGELGPRGSRVAFDALVALLEQARELAPRTPVLLLGHSWGSLLAQQVLARRSELLHGLVLSGTTLPLPGFLNPGDLDAPWRRTDVTGLAWLSRDPATQDAFAADPLCFDIAERPLWTPWQSLQLVSAPPPAWRGRVDDVPVLILAGERDTIGYGARGPAALERVLRRRTGLSDVTRHTYPGARHEVFNETNREEVQGDLLAWITTRFAPRPKNEEPPRAR